MEWITDKLPDLEVSLSHGFFYRSKRVLIYHRIEGYQFAVLYAGEGENPKWWRKERYSEDLSIDDVLGWMPISALPTPPKEM